MSNIQLYNGDCLEVMKQISDKSIDMICCDLPYEVTQNKADIKIPFEPLWKEYNRIIKDNGCIALFAQGIFYVDLVNSNRKMFRYDLVWDKVLTSGFLNAKRMPLRQHEQIAIFYKKQPTYNPQMLKGKPYERHLKYNENRPNNHNWGIKNVNVVNNGTRYPESVIFFQQKWRRQDQIHPTQKPVELLEWLIKTYTNENDLVIDATMGSGTTGVACKNTNRNFIGIELDENYFNIAKERIENV